MIEVYYVEVKDIDTVDGSIIKYDSIMLYFKNVGIAVTECGGELDPYIIGPKFFTNDNGYQITKLGTL